MSCESTFAHIPHCLRKGTTPNISEPQINVVLIDGPTSLSVRCFPGEGGSSSSAASELQLSVSMLAGLQHVELLMLALDLLVEAEQLVLSTGAGVVLLEVAVLPVELVCVSMDTGL